ncbi:MAG: ComEC/Rec2 family competence protein [Clostridium sp.]|nr:ComEC/Rec2 family competence protein [Clostridium sp.]
MHKIIHKIRKNYFLIIPILIVALIYIFSNLSTYLHSYDNYSIDNMVVHYIDVGQGDCILVQVNNKNLLIDSGPSSSKNKLMKYLKEIKLSTIDYVIATHPHEDHIGNMNRIIDSFDITNFYAPKVSDTSKSFEDMVYSLKKKNLKINIIKRGTDNIDLGNNTNVSVFSPINDSYDNLNNYSPVIKIEYGSTSFLFTGDAEKEVEQDIVNHHDDISADVLKIGHHGSSTSTSSNFLKAVKPSAAVISVGKNNVYNHPNKETLDRLTQNNASIYRTDIDKNILLISNGNTIKKLSIS